MCSSDLILQGQIEQAMRLSGDQPIQVQLSQMLDEAGRLSSITRKLLLLSQADAGKLALLRMHNRKSRRTQSPHRSDSQTGQLRK